MQNELEEFLTQVVATKGLQFDERGISHAHNREDPDAIKPPFKFHLCTPRLRPEGRLDERHLDQIAKFIGDDMLQSKKVPHALVGLPNVGEDIAKRVWMYLRGQGMHVPRLQLQKEGDSLILIDRAGHETCELWLIDDLLHYGHSKRKAIAVLEAEGYSVTDLWCFLTYAQGGESYFSKLGIETHHVATVRRVFDLAKRAGTMLPQVHDEGTLYLNQGMRSD